MSREIDNLKNNFRKAREEGERMLKDGRITWEMFCDIMRSFETDLKGWSAVGLEGLQKLRAIRIEEKKRAETRASQ